MLHGNGMQQSAGYQHMAGRGYSKPLRLALDMQNVVEKEACLGVTAAH